VPVYQEDKNSTEIVTKGCFGSFFDLVLFFFISLTPFMPLTIKLIKPSCRNCHFLDIDFIMDRHYDWFYKSSFFKKKTAIITSCLNLKNNAIQFGR